MEEGTDRTRLIIGIVAVVVVLFIAFFLLRGLFAKKPSPSNIQPTPTPNAALPSYAYPTVVPTNMQNQKGNTTKGGLPVHTTTGTTYTNTVAPTTTTTYWYYQSQGSSSTQGNQSQNQDNDTQSQSQTLPGAFTQSQNQ